MKHLQPYIIDKIQKHDLRYEVHNFDSGAVMIDIWIKDGFYVIQIEEKLIGISQITEVDPGFSTRPEHSYKSDQLFKEEFEKIFL